MPENIKNVHIQMTKEEHDMIKEVKKGKTWYEFLIESAKNLLGNK
jgi:hypothetical protein